MFDSYLDIVEERDGMRVRLQYDETPSEPYDDGATPILRIGGDYYGRGEAEPFNKQANGFEDAWNKLFECARNNAHHREIFERYVRIFHGASKVQFWNEGVSNECGYVAFDTAEWREKVGAQLDRLAAEDFLSEVRAWATGDVYGYIVEKELSYEKKFFDAEGEDVDEETGTEWIEVDDGSCWGFYGREWAEQAAKTALDDALTHEGISAHYAAEPAPKEPKPWTLEKHVDFILAALPTVNRDTDVYFNKAGTDAIIWYVDAASGTSNLINVDAEGRTDSTAAEWSTGYDI